eukprot:CAMPEP_0197608220 /NCGR_PEP_ID=MMETSP1326-20131121/48661_1 /TAXON_ID=1155430 /ORGANISM="Genus nov. species nov., Strain RCC2288" /LENGTH=39 /DNA_ID= /DNA_START= /DNA_END= /DNA_ORIENTATION=
MADPSERFRSTLNAMLYYNSSDTAAGTASGDAAGAGAGA